MASTDAVPVPRKNVAYRLYFGIVDADGGPVTGAAALDSEVSIDGAAFNDLADEAHEIGASGVYYLDLAQAEMNGDCIVVQVKTSTVGAKTFTKVIYPEEAGDYRAAVTSIAANAINATAIASNAITSAKLAANAIDDTILKDGCLTAGKIATGAITNAKFAAGAIDAASVAADTITAIWAKAMSDLAAVPAAGASVLAAINWLYMLARNKRIQTATTETVYKDDSTTAAATSVKSDDGTTFSRNKYT